MSTQSVVFLILSLIINTHAFSKSVNLSNSHLGGEGIALQIRATHVNTSNNVLHINPRTQRDTDLELILDQQWGFHPQVPSTIHITIDGFTPNITKTDGEFLMLFAVDNHQYFSAVIRLEDKSAWQSYPSYEQQPLATSDDIFRNIIVPLDPNRWIRLSNNDQFEPIGPGLHYRKELQWPLHITITNNPIQNTTTYQCTNCILPGRILTVTYTSSFVTEKGMKVYIMNDASDGKPFDIYYIGVTYQYETETPTKTPTIAPFIPTRSPSTAPTTPVPTKAPSTPSPIIVIPPSFSTTVQPTVNEIEQIGTTQRRHTTEVQTVKMHEDSEPWDDKLILYLIIVICVIVIICCWFKQRKTSSVDEIEVVEPMEAIPLSNVGPDCAIGDVDKDDDADKEGCVLLMSEIKAAKMQKKGPVVDISDSDGENDDLYVVYKPVQQSTTGCAVKEDSEGDDDNDMNKTPYI